MKNGFIYEIEHSLKSESFSMFASWNWCKPSSFYEVPWLTLHVNREVPVMSGYIWQCNMPSYGLWASNITLICSLQAAIQHLEDGLCLTSSCVSSCVCRCLVGTAVCAHEAIVCADVL